VDFGISGMVAFVAGVIWLRNASYPLTSSEAFGRWFDNITDELEEALPRLLRAPIPLDDFYIRA